MRILLIIGALHTAGCLHAKPPAAAESALEREARAQAQVRGLRSGALGEFLSTSNDIELAVVLEAFGKNRLLINSSGWTREDLSALDRAALDASSSANARLKEAGSYALAMVRLAQAKHGGLRAYLQDPDLPPTAAAYALYWWGMQRSRVTAWDSADIQTMHQFLEPFAQQNSNMHIITLVELLASEAHSSGRVATWWRDELSDAEAAVWMYAFARKLDATTISRNGSPPVPLNDLAGLDFWIKKALAAPEGTRFRRAGSEAVGRRCSRVPAPTVFQCPASD